MEWQWNQHLQFSITADDFDDDGDDDDSDEL